MRVVFLSFTNPEITEVIGTYDWDPIKDLTKQEKEEKFENYLNNSLTDTDHTYD